MSSDLAELIRDTDAMPEGWRTMSFSAVADYVNGRAFKPEDWGTEGLPIIRIAQITNADAETNFYNGAVDPRNLIDDDDLIFSWSATLAVMRWRKGPAVLNQHLFKVTPAKGIDRDWLQFRLEASIPDLADEAHGTTMKHIRKGTLSSQSTIVPPLDEQRRIAEVLRSVNEAIAATSNLSRQSDELWHTMAETAIWRRAVTQPDCVRQLSQAILASDYGVNASLTSEPIGHAILRMGNIQDGQIDPADMKWAVIQEGEAQALALQVGDILFNRTNSRDLVGKVALVREPTDCLYASYIVRLRVNVAVADPYYVFAAMHSRRAQAQFKSIATPGVSQSNINPTNLKKQMFPLPPLHEQQEIAGHLRALEVTRQNLLHELAALRRIKADVMSDLLSGHVRVPA